MPSLLDKTGIWNAALDLLNEQPVSSTSDTLAPAKWLARNYDQQRDYLLARYYWKFAMTRTLVPEDPTAPDWQWSNRYAIPENCLRYVPPTYDGQWNGTPIPFEEENNYILCNVAGGLRLRHVQRVDQEGLFAVDFSETLSIRLALKLSGWLTGKASFTQQLDEMFRITLADAKTTGAIMVAQDNYYDTDILSERVSYG
jgi:hypothetical protein